LRLRWGDGRVASHSRGRSAGLLAAAAVVGVLQAVAAISQDLN
jgi:hypothetical protein